MSVNPTKLRVRIRKYCVATYGQTRHASGASKLSTVATNGVDPNLVQRFQKGVDVSQLKLSQLDTYLTSQGY